jgi:hypothetical protein
MQIHPRTALIALTAAVVLAIAASAASANRLSTSERSFLIRWSPLTFSSTAGSSIRCSVTLDGSFHSSTITKTTGLLIGYINGATIAGTSGNGREVVCAGGTATALRETFPWHAQYNGFGGTLPRITAINFVLIGESLRVDPEGSFEPACLMRSEAAHPGRGIINLGASGEATGMEADETALIPLSGGFGCGIAEGRFSGRGTIQNAANTANITVRLI